MNLADLSPNITVTQIEKLYKNQFSAPLKVSTLSLRESKKMLSRTQGLIREFKHTDKAQYSEKNPTYLRLRMVEEASSKRIADLVESYTDKENSGSRTMTPNYVKALRAVAGGATLSENLINSLKVSRGLRHILESRKLAVGFMRKIVEAKRSNNVPLMEGEIDSAQTVLAAQDIADQIQSMIEKFADIQYKELPALHDSIRNSQGVAEAEQFNASVLDSLSTLTQALETAKADVNNAVATLTGQEVASAVGDLDIDGLEGDGMDMDMNPDDELGMGGPELDVSMDDDLGDEFDMSFEPEDESGVLGRERR